MSKKIDVRVDLTRCVNTHADCSYRQLESVDVGSIATDIFIYSSGSPNLRKQYYEQGK
jgi:hypothetical protein